MLRSAGATGWGGEAHTSQARLLGCSRIYQAYVNNYRRLLWKAGQPPVRLFRAAQAHGHQPRHCLASIRLDRFLHHAGIIEITGRSCRLKDKARRNEKDTCKEGKEGKEAVQWRTASPTWTGLF